MAARWLGRNAKNQCGYFLFIVATGFLAPLSSATAGVNQWTPLNHGMNGGRIQSIVCDPANSKIAYAGTGGAGVYKTTDGGERWMEANNGLSHRNIVQMAIHPDSPGTVYAGTSGGGLYKTTDGGENWDRLGMGGEVNASTVEILALNKAAPDTLFVKCRNAIHSTSESSGVPVTEIRDAVFRSDDGGSQWSQVHFGGEEAGITAIATDPNHANIVYAGTEEHGILKSADGGATWGFVNSGLDGSEIRTIAVSPVDANRIWAGCENGKVFRSADGGLQWTLTNGGLNDSGIRVLLPDAANSGVLYAGNGTGVFKTTNGGDNWADVGGENMDAPVEAIAVVSSDPDTLFVGTRFGLFKTSDGAVGWVSASEGIRNVSIRTVVVNPIDPDILYAGSRGYGLFKTLNRGVDWFPVNDGLTGFTVEELEISRGNPDILYARTSGSDGGLFKTQNGGGHWDFLTDQIDNNSIQTLAIHPDDPNILYASGTIGHWYNGALFKTTDGGANWTDISPSQGWPLMVSLAVAPSQPDTVYAGTYGDGVLKMTDKGEDREWIEINPQGNFLASEYIKTLAVSPLDPKAIYVGEGIPLFKAGCCWGGDGGVVYIPADWPQWDEIHYARELRHFDNVVVNPLHPKIAYAAGSQSYCTRGFFKTVTGGATWGLLRTHDADSQNGTIIPSALALDGSDPHTIYGGTPNGVWVYTDVPDPGDLNGDTFVNLLDAVVALSIVSGRTIEPLYNGDLTGDDRIGVEDAIAILRRVAEF